MTENTPQNDEAELLDSSKGQDDPKNEQSETNSPAEAQSGDHKDSALTSEGTSSSQESPENPAEPELSESIPPKEDEDAAEPNKVSSEAAEITDDVSEAAKTSEAAEITDDSSEATNKPDDSNDTSSPPKAPLLSMDSDADLVYDIEDTRSHNVEAFRRGHKTVLLDRPNEALDGPAEEPVPEPEFESEVKATEAVENSPAEVEGPETVVYHDLVEGELSFETQAPTLDEVMIPQSVEVADELVDDSHWTETAGLESDPDNFPYVSNMPKTMRMDPSEAGRVLDESSSDVPFTDIAALDPDFDKTTAEDLPIDSEDPVFDRSRSESGEFDVAQLSPLEALEAVDEILDSPAPEPHGKAENKVPPDQEDEAESQSDTSSEQAAFPAPNGPNPAAQYEDQSAPETNQDEQDPPSSEEEPVFPATAIPEALPYDSAGDEESEDEKVEKQSSETQLYNKILIAPATVEESDKPSVQPQKFDRDASRRATIAMTNPLGMDEITASLQEISSSQKTTRFSDPLTATSPVKDEPFTALDAPLEEIPESPEEDTPPKESSVSRSSSGRLERPPPSSKITESQRPSSLFSNMKNRRDSQKLSPRRRPTSSLVRPDLPKKSLNTPLRQFSSNIPSSAAEQAPGRIRQDALEEIFKRWQDIKKEDIEP